jgi:hypothetical protein
MTNVRGVVFLVPQKSVHLSPNFLVMELCSLDLKRGGETSEILKERN